MLNKPHNITLFTSAISQKNGGNASILDLSHASVKLGNKVTIFTFKWLFDYIIYKPKGVKSLISSHRLMPPEFFIHFLLPNSSIVKSIRNALNTLCNLPMVKWLFPPIANSIVFDAIIMPISLIRSLKISGNTLILNHAGSVRAFTKYFLGGGIEEYLQIVQNYDYLLFQSQEQIDDFTELALKHSLFPKPLLLTPSCHESLVHKENVKCSTSADSTCPINIAIIGSIQPRKNQLSAVAIAQILRSKDLDFHFHIIGPAVDLDYFSALQQEIDFNNFSRNFTLHGHSDHHIKLLSKCDILLQLSFAEGLSRACREALFLSKPIITYDIPGSSDIVKHNWNGFICNYDDINLVSDSIQKLAQDRRKLSEFSANSFKLYDSKFSQRVYLQNVKLLLDHISQ